MARKKILIGMLLLSQGFFNASTWPGLSVKQVRHVLHAVMTMYLALFGLDKPDTPGVSDNEILHRESLLMPASILQLHRTRLLIRLCCNVACGILLYWASALSYAYSAPSSWPKSVFTDLQRLASQATELEFMRGADLRK